MANFKHHWESRLLEILPKLFIIVGCLYAGLMYILAIGDIAATGGTFFWDNMTNGCNQEMFWNHALGASGKVCAFCIATSILKVLIHISYGIRFQIKGYVMAIFYVSLLFIPVLFILISIFTSFSSSSGILKAFICVLFIIFMIANVIVVPIWDWKVLITHLQNAKQRENSSQ